MTFATSFQAEKTSVTAAVVAVAVVAMARQTLYSLERG